LCEVIWRSAGTRVFQRVSQTNIKNVGGLPCRPCTLCAACDGHTRFTERVITVLVHLCVMPPDLRFLVRQLKMLAARREGCKRG